MLYVRIFQFIVFIYFAVPSSDTPVFLSQKLRLVHYISCRMLLLLTVCFKVCLVALSRASNKYEDGVYALTSTVHLPPKQSHREIRTLFQGRIRSSMLRENCK